MGLKGLSILFFSFLVLLKVQSGGPSKDSVFSWDTYVLADQESQDLEVQRDLEPEMPCRQRSQAHQAIVTLISKDFVSFPTIKHNSMWGTYAHSSQGPPFFG